MAPLIYFDNSIVRLVTENPYYWNGLYDSCMILFPTYSPVTSYYLFFEYIGVTKANFTRPSEEMLKFDDIKKSRKKAEKKQRLH